MAYEKMMFHGQCVWFDPTKFDVEGGCALGWPYQFNEDGRLSDVAFDGPSFAYALRDEGVLRFGRKIGDVSDLVPGWRE